MQPCTTRTDTRAVADRQRPKGDPIVITIVSVGGVESDVCDTCDVYDVYDVCASVATNYAASTREYYTETYNQVWWDYGLT